MQNLTGFLSYAGYFVLALAVLIAVHEFGHFWVARRLGVKVLRFSIGFGRPLLRHRARSDGTEYILAAVPLGGYVKMLDEREGDVPADQRHLAFNRQNLWKRSAIVAAGPLFNFAFAIALFWGLLVAGETGDRPLVGEVTARSVAASGGVRPGRRDPAGWRSQDADLGVCGLRPDGRGPGRGGPAGPGPRDRRTESVRRLAGSALASLPENPAILSALGLSQARPLLPPVIGEVVPGGAAEAGGLLAGDRVIEADGEPVATWQAWVDLVRQHPERALRVRVQRGEAELDLAITPRRQDEQGRSVGKIGAAVAVPETLVRGLPDPGAAGPARCLGRGHGQDARHELAHAPGGRADGDRSVVGKQPERSHHHRRNRGQDGRLRPVGLPEVSRRGQRQPRRPQPVADPGARRRAPALLPDRGCQGQPPVRAGRRSRA